MLILKKCKILSIALLIAHSGYTQNLVPNGDFEGYSFLPNNYGQSNHTTGWNNVNGIYSGPPYASPDYFNTAGTVPTSFGQIMPFSGNGQMGFTTYVFFINNFREYISTTLVSPLVVGTQYQVSFALSNGNNGGYTKSTNNIGVCFSTSPFFQLVDQPIPANPQIEITTITYNSNLWQTYTFFFTATSAFNHITIGNFRDDANTLVSSTGSSGSYYFIDNIVVQPATPLPIELISFTGKNFGDNNILKWSTASETNNDYFTLEKSKDAIAFQAIANIDGAGNSTTILNYVFTDEMPFSGINYYRLKQTDFDGGISYSKIIPITSNSKNGNDFLIYPNPATNILHIELYNSPLAEIKIINVLGAEILSKQIHDDLNTIDVSEFSNGIYFVTATTDGQQINSTKLIISK